MIVNILSGLGAGGAESALKNLKKYISKDFTYIDFPVISLSDNISEKNVDYDYKVFNLKGFNIYNLLYLIKHLRSLSVNKNINFFYWMYDACFISIIVSLFIKINVSWYIHHNLLSSETDSIKHKLMIKVLAHFSNYKFVEYIYFASHQSMNLHIKNYNFAKHKCKYFPNCVEVKEYSSFNISNNMNDCLNIGCFGRYVKVKNHDFLFNVCKELKSRGISIHLHLAGIGLDSDNLELINKLKDNGILSETTLYGQVDDVISLYDKIDIYLMCSLSEAFPMVVIESFQRGKYVVSSNVGDVGLMIDKNGCVINDYSVDSFCFEIIKFINYDCCYKYKIAVNDFNYVQNFFSFDSILKKQPIFSNLFHDF